MTRAAGGHVLYDGDCVFCVRSVAHLRRWAAPGWYTFLSFRKNGVLDAFPGVTGEDCARALQLVTVEGRRFEGAAVVVQVLRSRPWAAPLALYWVPGLRWLCDTLYGWVARNRFRLLGRQSCDGGTCGAHRGPPGGGPHPP